VILVEKSSLACVQDLLAHTGVGEERDNVWQHDGELARIDGCGADGNLGPATIVSEVKFNIVEPITRPDWLAILVKRGLSCNPIHPCCLSAMLCGGLIRARLPLRMSINPAPLSGGTVAYSPMRPS
jgi:hypothetical protein